MTIVSTFAKRITELMEIKKLSKSELAAISGINKSNITRYCKGDYKAKQDVVYQIADKLEVNPAWLMGYDIEMDKISVSKEALATQQREALFLEMLRQLTPQQQEMILAQLQGIVHIPKGQGYL